jgi:hypothetical protein
MQPVIDSDPKQTDGWWRRNWKWLLPVSALGAAGLAMILAFFGVIAVIVVGSLNLVRTCGPARTAVARAASTPAVVAALGSPVQEGWLVNGTLDPGRYAKLTVPISGPSGNGRIELEASCKDCPRRFWPFGRESEASAGWSFSTLVVELSATGQRIDLLADGTER